MSDRTSGKISDSFSGYMSDMSDRPKYNKVERMSECNNVCQIKCQNIKKPEYIYICIYVSDKIHEIVERMTECHIECQNEC